jgi:GNAT superfamily N-acetyltransferase
MRIRATRPDDLVGLQRIELAAGQLFHAVGMPAIADAPLPTIEELHGYVRTGRSWVADDDGRPVAFILVELVDGAAHIEQVSVDPAYARRGLGAELIDHVGAWAANRGLAALTLTTFRNVPWNAPYYARLGFAEMPPAERGPRLTVLMAEEAERGLDPNQRVAMRRPNKLDR